MNSNTAMDLIVFLSPAGTMQTVANIISDSLTALDRRFKILDLGEKDEQTHMTSVVDILSDGRCLWIGSPIYTHYTGWGRPCPKKDLRYWERPRSSQSVP